jgi:hypothetical protein
MVLKEAAEEFISAGMESKIIKDELLADTGSILVIELVSKSLDPETEVGDLLTTEATEQTTPRQGQRRREP